MKPLGYRALGVGLILLLMSAPLVTAQPQELPLGSTLPMQDHTVQRVDGTNTTIGALAGEKGTVFIFWSNQCPWIDQYEERVLNIYRAHSSAGVRIVLINANDPVAFPQEAAAAGQAKNYPMPYVMDVGSRFAEAVGAFRTPHVFVFDGSKTLVYTGGIDDSPGDPSNVQHTYLLDVIQALAQGTAAEPLATKAFGCRIKFQGVGG